MTDPVEAAREWLARRGMPVPDPNDVGPDRQPTVPPASRRQAPAVVVEAAAWDAVPLDPTSGDATSCDRTVGDIQTGDANAEDDLPAARTAGRGKVYRGAPTSDAESRPGSQVDRSRRDGDGPSTDEPDADPESAARELVLRKLAVQARSRHELAQALRTKGVPVAVADLVLDRMEAVGLVNDATFASDWVTSRQQRRHLSKATLRRELEAKGVASEGIEAALQQVAHEDELTAARRLAERKLKSMVGLPYEVQYRRLAGALGRRGFGCGVSTAVLSEVLVKD